MDDAALVVCFNLRVALGNVPEFELKRPVPHAIGAVPIRRV